MMDKSRGWMVCGWLAAALAGPAMGAATVDPEAGWAAVAGCAQQVTERARHSCVDQVLRDAGLLTPQMSEQQQRRAFGFDNAAPPAAAAPVPPAPAPAPAAPASARKADPDRMEAQIAAVATSADGGKLVITTSEGAVWRQTEALKVLPPPQAGDQLNIRKGALGSYLCRIGSSASWRCTRSR